jgi:hypothetical protein
MTPPQLVRRLDIETHHTTAPNIAPVQPPFDSLIDDEDALDDQPFLCKADYHILKDAPPFAFAIYTRAQNLSYRTGKFYSSVETVANFYGKNESTVTRCYQSLVDIGYFEVFERRPFSPTCYIVLDHDKWAEKHPGQCRAKFEYVWAGEGDELAQLLFSTTGGRVKLYENQMKSIRQIMAAAHLADAQLVQIFDAYYQRDGRRHTNPKNVIPVFINWLKKYKV